MRSSEELRGCCWVRGLGDRDNILTATGQCWVLILGAVMGCLWSLQFPEVWVLVTLLYLPDNSDPAASSLSSKDELGIPKVELCPALG